MTDDVFERGMVVRREVLGEAHVDRATASATDLTEDFQRFAAFGIAQRVLGKAEGLATGAGRP